MCCIFCVISPVAKQLQQWYVHKSPTISLTSTICYGSVQKWFHSLSLAQMEMQILPIVNAQQRVITFLSTCSHEHCDNYHRRLIIIDLVWQLSATITNSCIFYKVPTGARKLKHQKLRVRGCTEEVLEWFNSPCASAQPR